MAEGARRTLRANCLIETLTVFCAVLEQRVVRVQSLARCGQVSQRA